MERERAKYFYLVLKKNPKLSDTESESKKDFWNVEVGDKGGLKIFLQIS